MVVWGRQCVDIDLSYSFEEATVCLYDLAGAKISGWGLRRVFSVRLRRALGHGALGCFVFEEVEPFICSLIAKWDGTPRRCVLFRSCILPAGYIQSPEW